MTPPNHWTKRRETSTMRTRSDAAKKFSRDMTVTHLKIDRDSFLVYFCKRGTLRLQTRFRHDDDTIDYEIRFRSAPVSRRNMTGTCVPRCTQMGCLIFYVFALTNAISAIP